MSGETGNENIHVRITCPHCRKALQRTAAWINANDYVRCDFCREAIGLNLYKKRISIAQARDKVAAAVPKSGKRKR